MNLADTFRVLVRRWYLTLPALVLAFAAALFAYANVKPTYDRTASLLLLPGSSSIPAKSNPYLYLSGLGPVADVLTRAAASQEFLDQTTGEVKSNAIVIGRDATTSSPVVTIQASSESDATAAAMLTATVDHVTETLDTIQQGEGIPAKDRVTLQTLSMDTVGTPVQKTRVLITGIIAVGGLLFAVLLPAIVEGASRRPARRAGRADAAKDGVPAEPGKPRPKRPTSADTETPREPAVASAPAASELPVTSAVPETSEDGRRGHRERKRPRGVEQGQISAPDPVPEQAH